MIDDDEHPLFRIHVSKNGTDTISCVNATSTRNDSHNSCGTIYWAIKGYFMFNNLTFDHDMSH